MAGCPWHLNHNIWVLPLMATCIITVGSYTSTYFLPFLQGACSYLLRAMFLDSAAFSNDYASSAVPALPAVTCKQQHQSTPNPSTWRSRQDVQVHQEIQLSYAQEEPHLHSSWVSGSQAACGPVLPAWGTCIILMHLLYCVEVLNKAFALIYQVQFFQSWTSQLSDSCLKTRSVRFLLLAFWGGRF